MLKKIAGIAVFMCLLAGSAAPQQQKASDEYTVGSRDVLYVAVWAGGSLEREETVEVTAEGTISLFWLGQVEVGGMTVLQIRDKITALLADGYYKNPVVVVRINEYKSKEVIIQGAVQLPGTYDLESNTTTLLKLISMAGGTSLDRGSSAYIFRGGAYKVPKKQTPKPEDKQSENQSGDQKTEPVREDIPESLKGNEKIEVPLNLLLDEGDNSYDYVIYPGDYVYVVKKSTGDTRKHFVYVEGAVKAPQKLDYVQGLTALQAVIQCGGFTDVSAPNRSYITREGPDGKPQTIRVKLKDIQKGKSPDVELKPGDVLLVKESYF